MFVLLRNMHHMSWEEIMMCLLRSCAIALIATLAVGEAAAQENYTLRLSTYKPSNSKAWTEVYVPYAERIAELSDGRITIEAFPDGTLHSAPDGFKAIAGDITDVTPAFPVYMSSSFDLVKATELPLAYPNVYVATRVINELYPEYFRDEFERLGTDLAFTSVTSPYDIITKVPVNSVEDLKGLKIRSAGGLISTMLELLGAVPVNISIGDTYAAFQQGVVDGVILSTAAMADYRLYDVAKYNYRLNGALIWIPNAMNPDFYDPLPDDLKEVLAVAGREAAMNNAIHYDNLTKDALALMDEAGVTTVEPSPEDMAEIEKRLAPIWDDFVANSANPERAQELVDQIRALSDKYAAMTPEEIIALDEAEPV